MEFSDIKFLIELQNINEVNRYLQRGWILVKIFTKSYDPDIAPDNLVSYYILGATKNVDYSKELNDLNKNNKFATEIDQYFSDNVST